MHSAFWLIFCSLRFFFLPLRKGSTGTRKDNAFPEKCHRSGSPFLVFPPSLLFFPVKAVSPSAAVGTDKHIPQPSKTAGRSDTPKLSSLLHPPPFFPSVLTSILKRRIVRGNTAKHKRNRRSPCPKAGRRGCRSFFFPLSPPSFSP